MREEQLRLLDQLSQMGSQGRAEGESRDRFPRTFHVVPEHVRAFDTDVVLIVGPRGSGKSELFRAVMELGLLPAIGRHATGVRLPPIDPKRTRWLPAYPIGAAFPDAGGLRRFLRRVHEPSSQPMLELWFASLCRVVWEHLDAGARRTMTELRTQAGGDPDGMHAAFRRVGNAPVLALDRLDEQLAREDGYVFVGYDELDTLGGVDWETMGAAIQNLVSFWASYARRWRRIRAKVFLRTDLYQRFATAGGADLAKLAANRAEIAWSNRSLYGMVVKRIANASVELQEYCEKARLQFERDPELGVVPRLVKAEDAKALVERLVGTYMGAGQKKGLAFRWLLDHIRDGRGHALPRPLVRLVEQAAEQQRNSGRTVRWPRLLDPTSLRRALDVVSQEHVGQSTNEWPWLPSLTERVRDQQVPWDRRIIDKLIEKHWDAAWSTTGAAPASSAPEFVDYLIEVGVFRARPGNRVDVPDLFLAGLGLKRKGGVRRQ
jgi:energy-coupling factor transporter ATP-binding protein EcfA2